MRNAQRGNILFLILLAVVLFAALSYAVTGSQRGGVKDASSETASSCAARLLAYGSLLEQTISRMQMVSDVPLYKIDTKSDLRKSYQGTSNPHDNFACASNEEPVCGLYNQTPYQTFEDCSASASTSSLMPGHHMIQIAPVQNLGTDKNDLLLRVEWVLPAVCREINRSMGIASTPNNWPGGNWLDINAAMTAATLDTAGLQLFGSNADTSVVVAGKHAFCVLSSVTGGFFYYAVATR